VLVCLGHHHDHRIDSRRRLSHELHLRCRQGRRRIAHQHQDTRLLRRLGCQFGQSDVEAADSRGVDQRHVGHARGPYRHRGRRRQLLDLRVTDLRTVGGHPLREFVDRCRPRRPGREEQFGGFFDVEAGIDGDGYGRRRGDLDADGTQVALSDQRVDQRTLAALDFAHHDDRPRLAVAREFGGRHIGEGVHLVGAQHGAGGFDNGRRVTRGGLAVRGIARLCTHRRLILRFVSYSARNGTRIAGSEFHQKWLRTRQGVSLTSRPLDRVN